jgi:hypothetical protein
VRYYVVVGDPPRGDRTDPVVGALNALLAVELALLVVAGPAQAGRSSALVVLPLMVLVLLVTAAGRALRVRAVRARHAAGPVRALQVGSVQARRAARPGPRPEVEPGARPGPDWAAARRRFHRLGTEYAGFECDPMAVLRLPALADVAVGSTGRFVEAFAHAQALETAVPPGTEHARQFVAAVDHAERRWQAAKDAAERLHLSGFPPAERAAVERTVKLLTTARGSDSEPERRAAYSLARAELARLDRSGVLHMPEQARAALDVAARGELPPSGSAVPP